MEKFVPATGAPPAPVLDVPPVPVVPALPVVPELPAAPVVPAVPVVPALPVTPALPVMPALPVALVSRPPRSRGTVSRGLVRSKPNDASMLLLLPAVPGLPVLPALPALDDPPAPEPASCKAALLPHPLARTIKTPMRARRDMGCLQ